MSDQGAGLDLAGIKARAEAATKGPWEILNGEYVTGVGLLVAASGESWNGVSDANATFIAAARTDVPALVAEVERLRAVERDCHRLIGGLSLVAGAEATAAVLQEMRDEAALASGGVS